ncbi:ribonuclease HII [Actinomadura spongiicola]|uniref:Ribonuclease HII n=1 Tax=Actinomadura spongiicola TaxID=2303421 RepID=A0A372G899_9ACTN|nr:ribonuclease HII [Actinomadura spongiicola]RFS81616.1 ribonuclease HII [Actinomadura spongiicola]
MESPTDPTGALPGLEPGPAAKEISRVAGYEIEDELLALSAPKGRTVTIAGVDEVGRGAWAGPVVVCAAVTDLTPPPVLQGRGNRTIGLTDSKLLTETHRESFAALLPGWLTGHAIGESGPGEIDEVGMTEALRRAAVRALESLPVPPDVVILDGKHDFLSRPWRVRCEVKADQRSVTVAAASVLAKVHRDRLMAGLDEDFPGYGFADSAGYPSPVHQKALEEFGPTPHHRMSWSYLDDLPRWRHLKKPRDPLAGEGQLSLL